MSGRQEMLTSPWLSTLKPAGRSTVNLIAPMAPSVAASGLALQSLPGSSSLASLSFLPPQEDRTMVMEIIKNIRERNM
jgi:hypothetical protein